MNSREDTVYGKVIDYDPHWQGPLQIKREWTDLWFLVSFGVYLIVWLSTGFYAFATGEPKDDNRSHDTLSPSARANAISISIGFIVLGIFLTFLYLFLLRHFPRAVVVAGLFFAFFILFLSILVLAYEVVAGKPETRVSSIFGFFICVIAFISLVLYVMSNRKRIVIACGIVKESTKAVIFFPSTFLFPILTMILYGITLAFAKATYVYLSAHPSMRRRDPPGYLFFLQTINGFGALWMLSFIYAFSQMVLSGTFATWYWTMDKRRVPSHVLLTFMRLTARFHLGTLAFGSLIIAIVEAIKFLLRSLSQSLRDSKNNVGAMLFSCIGCMWDAVKEFIQYINGNAYIVCTMHGTDFLRSAKHAFNLLMRNAMNVVAVTSVTSAILYLGEFVVVFITGIAVAAYCQSHHTPENIMNEAIGIVFVSTLIMSIAIFEVLKTAINTIFLCVMEDYERNDGSNQRPFFMSNKLRQLWLQHS